MDSVVLGVGATAVAAALVAVCALRGGKKPAASTAKPKTQATASTTATATTGRKTSSASDETASLPLLRIFFGSQTGTAEIYAKQLRSEAAKHGFRGESVDMGNWKKGAKEALLGAEIAVFLMATYGEGDPTDTSKDFIDWLKDGDGSIAGSPEGGANLFSKMSFTVFGLGNRQYEKFNAVGKLTDARLAALGGSRIAPLGLGDADADMDADFDGWKGAMWAAVKAAAAAKAGGAGAAAGGAGAGAAAAAAADDNSLPDLPAFVWDVRTSPASEPPAGIPAAAAAAAAAGSVQPVHVPGSPAAVAAAAGADVVSRFFWEAVPVKVAANRELRQAPSIGASTRHVELDLTGSGLSYVTADNVHLLPENESTLVERAAAALGFLGGSGDDGVNAGVALDSWLTLEPAGDVSADDAAGAGAAPFPTPATLRTVLTRYFDLAGAPSRAFLGALAHFAGSEAEKESLARLASRAGSAAYEAWARAPQRSVVEALEAFPSLRSRIPLRALLHIMPRLHPRAYTIASSALAAPSRLAIVASVIDEPKPHAPPSAGGVADAVGAGAAAHGERRLRGVASNYLARLVPEGGAAGAGASAGAVASSEGSHRVWVVVRDSSFRLPRDPKTPVIMVGPGTGIAPFVGFLQERAHRRAVAGPASVGPAHLFFGCQRRDSDYIYAEELQAHARSGVLDGLHVAFSREGPNKVYVQHLMRERASELAELILRRNAHVYVCGATRMGKDVSDVLVEILQSPLPGSSAASEAAAGGAGGAGESGAGAQPPLTAAAAKEYVASMKSSHRYVQELWA